MKGPGIKDYLEVIENLKLTAIKEGKTCIEVNSKQLHASVSPEHATMPTCCQAIYKKMLEGDEILQRPKGNTGFGSHLTVRFQLHDLANRQRMFPDKKRGRPAKSEEEKLAARKAKWQPREPKVKTGYLARYASMVTSGNRGAILEVPKAK